MKPGDTLNYRVVQRAIKNLFATGQFDDVHRVHCDINPVTNKTTLVVHVVERPLLDGVTVIGATVFAKGSMRDKIDLCRWAARWTRRSSRSRSRRSTRSISENGYYLATVKVDSSITDGRPSSRSTFDEGHRLAICEHRVRREQVRSDTSTIMASFDTQKEGFFFWQSGEFDEDKLATDIGVHLAKLYNDRGYIDFQVQNDTLIVDPVSGKGIIHITLHEGPKYVVGNFEIVGNRHFSTEELMAYYPFTGQGPSLTARVSAS